ncbi:MAG: hypothetical protein AAB675_01935 [Patescibacteria group bacterium]
MNINPVVFFDMAISLFVVSIALAAMAISYTRVLKKLISHQEKYDDLLDKINEKELDLLEEARRKSTAIVEEATLKAQRIITEGDTLNINTKNLLEKSLNALIREQTAIFEKTSQNFLESYKNELSIVQNRTIEIARNVSKDIEEDTISEVKDFDNILAKETIQGQKIVGEKIEEEFSHAKKQVEEYRTEMLEKVNKNIYELLEKISKTAIGKSLAMSDHQALILDALEKAKKDGIKN